MKERNFLFFFLSCSFSVKTRAFGGLSLESAEKKDPHSSKDPRNQSITHMTARITYKRRYGFRCSRFFFAHIFARRGKRWRGRERVSERFSFARARVMCVYVRMRKFYARFSPSLLF